LLADASRIAWNDAHPQKPVDIALIHSGNIRGDKIIPPKEEGFTLRNLYEILPFDNPAYHIEMSGEMIQSILEHSLAHIVEGDVVLDKHSGSFMNFSGLRVKADLTRPYGQRISEIKTTNEDPIDPKKSYRVLIDSYIARKNAGFPMLYGYTEQNPSKVWKDTQINSDYIKAYFLKQKEKGATINPSIDGRWDITRSSK
jgi:2',3'-cyclic-nucleotide 2'-phosphodiesterase (5'-nucleotidase family)